MIGRRATPSSALAAGVAVVPFLLEGAAMPSAGDLPPGLARFAAMEPVHASSEYWDPSVARVVERLAPAPRRRRRIDGGTVLKAGAAAIATAASVVGILASLGVFPDDPPQRGTVAVAERAANGATLDRYLAELAGEDAARPPDFGVRPDTQGDVYRVDLNVSNPAGDRYALEWTMVDEGSGGPMAGFVDEVALRLAAEDVTGVHEVWIPCPEIDGQRYVISFDLVDEADRTPPWIAGRAPPATAA